MNRITLKLVFLLMFVFVSSCAAQELWIQKQSLSLRAFVDQISVQLETKPPKIDNAELSLKLPYVGDGYVISNVAKTPNVNVVYRFDMHPCVSKQAVSENLKAAGFVAVPKSMNPTGEYFPQISDTYKKEISSGNLMVRFEFSDKMDFRCAAALIVDGIH